MRKNEAGVEAQVFQMAKPPFLFPLARGGRKRVAVDPVDFGPITDHLGWT